MIYVRWCTPSNSLPKVAPVEGDAGRAWASIVGWGGSGCDWLRWSSGGSARNGASDQHGEKRSGRGSTWRAARARRQCAGKRWKTAVRGRSSRGVALVWFRTYEETKDDSSHAVDVTPLRHARRRFCPSVVRAVHPRDRLGRLDVLIGYWSTPRCSQVGATFPPIAPRCGSFFGG